MSDLFNIGADAAVNAPLVKIPTKNLALLSNEASPRELQEYSWNSLEIESSNVIGAGSVTGSIIKLAGLDVFVATTVSFLPDDGSDKAGCYQKNHYYKTFVSFLTIAYDQLV